MPEELTTKQAYERLRELQEEIRNSSIDAIAPLIAYQLMPLIDQCPPLRERKEQSLSFYQELARTQKYQSFVDEIHAILRKAHAAIDPNRIPSDVKINQWTTMQEFHAALPERDKWKRIEDARIGLFDPLWAPILEQYEETIPSFLSLAEGYGALGIEDFKKLKAELQECTQRLRPLLVDPWHRDCLSDFFWLDDTVHSILSGSELHANRMERARIWSQNVIRILIREFERYLPRRGRKFELKFDIATRTFVYKKTRHQFEHDTNPAKLCAVFYKICPISGKVEWKLLAQEMQRVYPSLGSLDREKIREIIRGLDRWLDDPDRSQLAAGGVLKMEGKYVLRMK